MPVTVSIPHPSVAVAFPGSTLAEHCPGSLAVVMFAGQVIVGGVLSLTVTVCRHDPVLPAASVAVQVIVVVPTGYGAVNAALSLRCPAGVTDEQLSVAVAVPGFTEALH